MKCFIRRIFVAAIIIVIWFVIAEGVNPLFIPGPDLVLRGIISLFDSGQLSAGIIFSFKRVTMASIFSGGLALVFGLFIYSIRYIKPIIPNRNPDGSLSKEATDANGRTDIYFKTVE